MKPRVVAVDMDGTFLRPGMTYDRERFLALRAQMRVAGVRFVVASGNQVQQLRSFFSPGDVDAYVAENGHFVHEGDDAEPFFAATVAPGRAEAMIDTLERLRFPYIASGPSGAFLPAHVSEGHARVARLYFHEVEVVEDPRSVADRVVKACLWTPEPLAVVPHLQDAVGDDFVAVVSGPEDIDLNVAGHHKASGLARLLERWGVGLDEVIAFGDNHNDLEMLEAVGLAVAMENARPEVIEAADRIAPPNTDDGVLVVLEEMFATLG